MDGDTARLALEATKLAPGAPLLRTGWMEFTYVEFYAYSFFLRIAGEPILGTRLLSASGGIATVVAVYLLARQLYGKRIGTISALLLSVLPIHLVFSRNGLNNTWPAAYASLSLYLLPSHPLLGGALAGLAQYSYHSAILIPILMAFYFVIRRSPVAHVVRAGAGFLMTFGPLIYYYLWNPEVYASKIDRTTIFRPDLELALGKRLFRNYVAFHLPVAANRLYYVYTPYLGIVARVLFTIGLLICAFRLARRPNQLMLFWYASGVFLGGVLVMGSPTPHRFVILLPPVVIMAAVGLDLLYGVAQRRLGRRLAAVSLLAVLSAYVITSLYVYWEHDTRDIYAADYNTQVGTYVGRFVEECRPGSWVYLLGDSRANDSRSIYYKAMPALMLLTAGRGSDVEPPFDPAKQYEKNAVFVLLPSRVAESDLSLASCRVAPRASCATRSASR